MQIKLFFQIFNANQLFSPIIGEHRNTRERLKNLSLQSQAQMKKLGKIPSKKLPTHIHITFRVNRDNFDIPALFLLAHHILGTLRLSLVIQDTNNRCISHVTISHKFVNSPIQEGCTIDFTD